MHVVLNAVSSATAPSGVCRHAANIARGLSETLSVDRLTLLVGPWQQAYFRHAFDLPQDRITIAPVQNSRISRNFWHAFSLPRLLRQIHADVLHLAFPVSILPHSVHVPVVLSAHDAYPFDIPHNFGEHASLGNKAALRLSVYSASAIACVSTETRQRIHALCPHSANRTCVIPNAVAAKLTPDPEFHSLPIHTPFLLCVAQHRANKNLLYLFHGFHRALQSGLISPDTTLAIVGDRGPETPHLLRFVNHHDLESHARFLSDIPDPLLAALYRTANVVIAPSIIEGFGLPVAEAMTQGARILCADIPAFRALDNGTSTFFPLDTYGDTLLSGLSTALAKPRPLPQKIFASPADVAAQFTVLYRTLVDRSRSPHMVAAADPLRSTGDL